MSSITGKVDTTVHKTVWTANPKDPAFLAKALLTAALREAMAGGVTETGEDAEDIDEDQDADDSNPATNPAVAGSKTDKQSEESFEC